MAGAHCPARPVPVLGSVPGCPQAAAGAITAVSGYGPGADRPVRGGTRQDTDRLVAGLAGLAGLGDHS